MRVWDPSFGCHIAAYRSLVAGFFTTPVELATFQLVLCTSNVEPQCGLVGHWWGAM